MNLYEYEGKKLFAKYGIATPKGVVVRRGDDVRIKYQELGIIDVVVKAQVLSGKRGKNNGIKFCSTVDEVVKACEELFAANLVIARPHPAIPSAEERERTGQYVAAVLIEEKLDIAEEHYVSITYDTNKKQPVVIYSTVGGMDIEDVPEGNIQKQWLDIREEKVKSDFSLAQALWNCFLVEDARQVEINPLVKTIDGRWVAADAKVAIDDDAFFRHGSTSSPQVTDWKTFEPRTMMGRPSTEREIMARKIDDEGEAYYRGTAGKYIEMDGEVATLFSSAGASINNMDALLKTGLKPANYTEYSGNPPREKVYSLAKIVLSKPGIKGLWIIGGVANFTNVAETFQGVVDALDEVKPTYPIVVRRAGPFEKEGMQLMADCAARNNLNMKLFGKETAMDATAQILVNMIRGQSS